MHSTGQEMNIVKLPKDVTSMQQKNLSLEETLNIISQLQASRTNIHRLIVQEWIGYGKFKPVLEGKTFNELKSFKDFNTYKNYSVLETNFLASGCFITVCKNEAI